MTYLLHEDAENDLREAATFYREQAGIALSLAFLNEFEAAVERLLRHPRLGAVWRHGKRRLLMSQFPYSILYMIEADELRIFAVAHHSRRPAYWRERRWNSR